VVTQPVTHPHLVLLIQSASQQASLPKGISKTPTERLVTVRVIIGTELERTPGTGLRRPSMNRVNRRRQNGGHRKKTAKPNTGGSVTRDRHHPRRKAEDESPGDELEVAPHR